MKPIFIIVSTFCVLPWKQRYIITTLNGCVIIFLFQNQNLSLLPKTPHFFNYYFSLNLIMSFFFFIYLYGSYRLIQLVLPMLIPSESFTTRIIEKYTLYELYKIAHLSYGLYSEWCLNIRTGDIYLLMN